MIEYRTKIEDTFLGIWFGGDNGNIVLGCGLPQYIGKYHPIIAQIKRLGYNLFIPRYQGTFESGGDFNTMSSKQSIDNAIRLAQSGKTTELFGNSDITWNNNVPIYLLGYSYGALPALLSEIKVDKTVLICPFVDIKYHVENTTGENLKQTFEFIERAYPNLYRLKADLVINDLASINLPDHKDNLTLVYASEDESIPKEEITNLSDKYSNIKIIEKGGKHSLEMNDELFLELFKKT